MTMPGYTAEAALGQSKRTYRGTYRYGGVAPGHGTPPSGIGPNQYEVPGGLVEDVEAVQTTEGVEAEEASLEAEEASLEEEEVDVLAVEEDLAEPETAEELEAEGEEELGTEGEIEGEEDI